MLVEIHGTGAKNRGAELMAIAIATRLRNRVPDIRLAVDWRFGGFEERARYGFWRTDDFSGRSTQLCARLAPTSFWEQVGVAEMRKATAVLDASGFAFSDQWGADRAQRLLNKMNGRKRRGKKLILLPQAFGPFENSEVAAVCLELFNRADLIFARDQASYNAVAELSGSAKLSLCPDFTILLKGHLPACLDLPERFAAIVPNSHMLAKTEDKSGALYFKFLKDCVQKLGQLGVTPVVVLHDVRTDEALLPRIFAETGELKVIRSTHPLTLKGVLGRAQVAIGSRFHALVGALSQAVPCVGAGWSHKYYQLFEDYGCSENLISDLTATGEIQARIAAACDPKQREVQRALLRGKGADLTRKVEKMWAEVEGVLGILPGILDFQTQESGEPATEQLVLG